MDKIDILSLHSKGEKNGEPFSSSSIPLSTLEILVHAIPDIIIGNSAAGVKKNDIKDAMSISINDGSLKIGVALPAIMASIIDGSAFSSDILALS